MVVAYLAAISSTVSPAFTAYDKYTAGSESSDELKQVQGSGTTRVCPTSTVEGSEMALALAIWSAEMRPENIEPAMEARESDGRVV